MSDPIITAAGLAPTGDIVERLNKRGRLSGQNAEIWLTPYDPLFCEAADEITRLRSGRAEVVEALKACAADWKSPPCIGAVYLFQEFSRRAEIARAALTRHAGEKK